MLLDAYFVDGFRWEIDFLRALLSQHHCRHHFSTSADLLASTPTFEGSRILIFSSRNTEKETVEELIDSLRPQVLIHLSDEYGINERYVELYDGVPLVLRQYYFRHYPQPDNQLIIPLGYMTGMFNPPVPLTEREVKPMGERRFRWSFVGNMKSDRRRMLWRFWWMRPRFRKLGGLSPKEMADAYGDSIFVPCGRGSLVLNCFRLYEATVCGALPVVAGPEIECRDLLTSQGQPPWIVARNWNAAYNECKRLLGEPSELARLQKENLSWWDRRITEIRSRIDAVL